MATAVSQMIDHLRAKGGLKGTDLANIAGVSPATASRWAQGRITPHPRTELLISDLRYIVDRLSEFYSAEETRVWLYARHRLLDDQRAIDLIHAGKADTVLAVIASLDDATFS
jgi:transcriptional regulator with XRE-family HTH domain